MQKSKTLTFHGLLEFFPKIELPVMLTEETVSTFDQNNKPLPNEAVDQFISQWEQETPDEYTEFIPCFQLLDTEEYIALVYWKGSLLKYEYFIVTLQKDGTLISRKSISSTIMDGQHIKKSVATIDEDHIIHIMAGANEVDTEYLADTSRAFSMEILPSGDILFSLGED